MLMRLAGVLAVASALASPAAPSFVAVDVGFSGIAAREVNWGDYDNDGDLDVGLEALEAGTRVTRLYKNTAGAFAHETNAVLFAYNEGPFIFGDYDNDGDLDILFGGWSGSGTGTRMHRNDGGGTFPFLANLTRGMKGADAAWADIDNDGDLDLINVGESYDNPQGDYSQILRNDGADVFTLIADLPGVYLGEVAVGDYDRDGDLDLALTGRTVGSRIYRNDGGIFTDLQAGLPGLINSSVAWADLDNDGDLDLALCGSTNGSTATHFTIYENVAGVFTALPLSLPAVHTGELDWADYDNDGDADLLVVGIDAGGTPVSRIYRNNGDKTFTDSAVGLEGVWNQSSAAWGDYDDDGDLDVILGGEISGGGFATKVYRSDGGTANTAPTAPTGVVVLPQAGGLSVGWNPSTDAETPSAGLTYNLRVGTTPGGQDVMAPMSDLSTGKRRLPARGNAQQNTAWSLRNLPAGTYYCSVQAVDGGFMGSPWSAEAAVVVSPGLHVTAMTPAPGAVLTSAPGSVTVTLDAAPDPLTVTSSAVLLAHAGGDGALGTPDDVLVHPVSIALAGAQITLDLSGQPLPNGPYRLRIRGEDVVVPDMTNWWRLDDLGGGTVVDSAGTHDGTILGTQAPTWTTAGRLGGALEFTGYDGRVFIGAADLAIPWTAAMWVRRADSPVEDARLIDSYTSSLRLEQYNHSNRVGFTVPTVVDVPFNYTAPVDQWVHLVFVGETDGVVLYADGVIQQKLGPAMNGPRSFLSTESFNAMHGRLDDVRLYSRRLSEDEIRAVASLGGALRGTSGERLDGDFAGSFPSGDGTQGTDFVADFAIAAPIPVVTGLWPAPGSSLATAPAVITASTNVPLDASTVSAACVRVTRAGPDTALGTGDDVTVTPTSVGLVGGGTIEIVLPGGLPDDHYQVVLSATGTPLSGLVNEWRLDDGSGSSATDAGSGAHGTLGGAGGGRPVWVVGRAGTALRFAGAQERVQIGAGQLAPPWTAAMWVRRDAAPVEASSLLDGPNFALRLEQFNHTKQLGYTVHGSQDLAFAATAPLGQWIHVAFVGEGDGTSLHVNGAFVQKRSAVISCPRTCLGAITYNSAVGVLDEIRIYNRVLSAAEIRNLAALGGALRAPSGLRLDGEFSGALPSGNGTAGGDFVSTFTVGTVAPPPPPPPPPPATSTTDLTAGGCGLLGLEALGAAVVLLLMRRRKGACLSLLILLAAASAQAQQEPPTPDKPLPQDAPKPQETPPPQDKPPAQDPPAPQENPPPQDVVEPAPTTAPEDPGETHGFRAAVRGGAWFVPEFDAQTAGGRRRLKSTSMGDVGLDLDARCTAWLLRVSFDAAQDDDLSAWVAGLHVGRAESLESVGLPVTVAGSAGVIGGALDVDVGGFGDFDAAIGFQARAEVTWPMAGRWGVSLWADHRRLAFEYEEPVLSGDDEAWGSTTAVGGALVLRF